MSIFVISESEWKKVKTRVLDLTDSCCDLSYQVLSKKKVGYFFNKEDPI